MKYNLLIDCASFDRGLNICSLDYYVIRLIKGFYEDGVFQVFVLVDEKKKFLFDELVGIDVPKIVINQEKIVSFWAQRLLGIIPFKKELKSKRIDVVLKTDLFTCNYYFGKTYHHHVIVHDMFPYYSVKNTMGPIRYQLWRFFRKVLTSKVKHFITISEATRKELLSLEGKDSDVVYNSLPFDYSVNETIVDSVRNIHYILYVSRFEKYKNAETLIRAFARIKDSYNHVLYLKGDMHHPRDYQELKCLVSDLGLDDRVIFDRRHLTEGEMRYLYSHADLFVHPSLKEGFGWTPIEAAVLKTPVIVSDIDVIKEVTCGRIPVFTPDSPEDLAYMMVKTLNNPPSNEEREQLKLFYMNRYSLKNQIDRMTEVIIHNLDNDAIKRPLTYS